ncbi:MAG TPA: LytTR family DNA-binding domain-containing protein [Candidatus Acidoferrum sp.]|nr:LytTR family DNA-binding domain-containing protein [Candidatus Acidoferrum sp.]
MRLRTLIIDDEVLARKKIRAFLQEYPEFQVVGECADGERAVADIKAHKPDLIFLDVQIPGRNGFEVLDGLEDKCTPAIIFVTAFDKYAVRAFEVRALDYLLKPFNKARFAEALNRFHEQGARLSGAERKEELKAVLQQLQRESREGERIAVKSGSRTIFLRKGSIEWVEAQGDYVKLHSGKECHLLRETMTAISERLDADRFVRIHRSRIVNLDYIREIRPLWGGDYTVLMRDGTELTMSRTYRATFSRRSTGNTH